MIVDELRLIRAVAPMLRKHSERSACAIMARKLGADPEAVRMRYRRACKRLGRGDCPN